MVEHRGKDVFHITNGQMRLLAASIALVAGALAAGATGLDVNVGIFIILSSAGVFIAEYVRSYLTKKE
jgi:hypothetical protein